MQYDCRVTNVDNLTVEYVIVKSNGEITRPVGWTNKLYNFAQNIAFRLIDEGRKYKPPKPVNIVCRACGNKSNWIRGTSKRSFVCQACRIL
jgi:hypothetical protein